MREAEQSLFTRRTAVVALVLLAVFVGLLHSEGRPAWCKTGFGVWAKAWTNCTSQHLFDPYTLSHVLHGVILYWLLRPLASRISLPCRLIAALGLEIGWEVLENSAWVIERYRQDTAAFDYTGDSILNAVGDALASIAGFVFAARFSWRASVAVFIIFELVMLLLARDNLSLNILMLLWPIEAIKEWQMSDVLRQ